MSLKATFALVSAFCIFSKNLVSSQTTTTTCIDAYECLDETIDTTYLKCYGYYACENATVDATYSYNYGYLGSYGSEQTAEYIYSSGLYSLLRGTLEVYIANVYGYLGAGYAEFSAYSSTLYVVLYGYLAGYYSDVICSSGDTCRVYCGEVYGCYDLSYYCYSGATCYYDCSDDSDYCPTLYSGVESDVSGLTELSVLKTHESGLSDDEIKDRYKTNKAKKAAHLRSHNNNPAATIKWSELDNGLQMKEQLEMQIEQSSIVEPNSFNNKIATVTKTNGLMAKLITMEGFIMFIIGAIGAFITLKVLAFCNKYDNGEAILKNEYSNLLA